MAEVQIEFSDEFDIWCEPARADDLGQFVARWRHLLGADLADNFFVRPGEPESDPNICQPLKYLWNREVSTRDASEEVRAILSLMAADAGGQRIGISWGATDLPPQFFAEMAQICEGSVGFCVRVVGPDGYTNVRQSLTPSGWHVDYAVSYEWDDEEGEYTGRYE